MKAGSLVSAALVLIPSFFAIPAAHAAGFTLGAEGGYAVFAEDNFSYNGPGTINGNVAVGQSVNLSNSVPINGTFYLNGGFSTTSGGSSNSGAAPTGGFSSANLTTAIANAASDAGSLAGMSATQTLGAVGETSNTTYTITGTSGTNVIDVSSLNFSSGTLDLSGTSSSVFIINDTGGFTFNNAGMQLSGGVLASNVIFNVEGSGNNVSITGGADPTFYGTVLDAAGNITVHDKTLDGELIGENVTDTSGFSVNNVPFSPTPAVPEPSTLVLLGTGLLGTCGAMKRRFAR